MPSVPENTKRTSASRSTGYVDRARVEKPAPLGRYRADRAPCFQKRRKILFVPDKSQSSTNCPPIACIAGERSVEPVFWSAADLDYALRGVQLFMVEESGRRERFTKCRNAAKQQRH